MNPQPNPIDIPNLLIQLILHRMCQEGKLSSVVELVELYEIDPHAAIWDAIEGPS